MRLTIIYTPIPTDCKGQLCQNVVFHDAMQHFEEEENGLHRHERAEKAHGN